MGKILKVVPNYRPHRKQVLLHNAPVSFDSLSITLYGGSRGGGKSAGILADAVLFATTYPGAKICILRESLDAVKQSFLDKLPTLFPQEVDGKKIYDYKEKSSSIHAPLSRSVIFPNGSYITFQRVANYEEAVAKQGWEFHYLGIDEVTKQDEKTVMYLLSTVRSVVVDNPYTKQKMRIPTKIVFGCNPGGIGHKWVKRRFIDRTVTSYDEKTRTPLTTKDDVQWLEIPDRDNPGKMKHIKVNVRFIPSSWRDNPFLDDAYVANLMKQPEALRKMDMDGCWDVVTGKMFEFSQEQFIEPKVAWSAIKEDNRPIEIFISIDWGYKPSYHCALWHAVLEDKRVITFKEMYGQSLIFEDFVKEISKQSDGMYISATLLPHDMFRQGDRYRDETGRIIGETKADVFESFGLNPQGVESGKGKVEMRNDKIHSATKLINPDGVYKFRISKGCSNLIEEAEHAVHDEVNPMMIAKGCNDHALDAYGLFLIYYSDDISPIGFESLVVDNRSKLERLLDEEEEYLNSLADDEDFISLDNLYDL